jgi:hypothetical protein
MIRIGFTFENKGLMEHFITIEARIWKPPSAAPGHRRARRSMDGADGALRAFLLSGRASKGLQGWLAAAPVLGVVHWVLWKHLATSFTTGSPADYSSDWGPPT